MIITFILGPANHVAWNNRSKILHAMHRNTEALECSEKACEQNPFWDQVSRAFSENPDCFLLYVQFSPGGGTWSYHVRVCAFEVL